MSEPNERSHFAAGMAWRRNPTTGRLEFLVIRYTQSGRPTSIKFPGGTNRRTGEKDPITTIRREWREEVGYDLLGICPKAYIVQDKGHKKFFFLIDPEHQQTGMRREIKIDVEEGRPDEHLGPPMWVEVNELLRRSGLWEIFFSHRAALEAAVRLLDPSLL